MNEINLEIVKTRCTPGSPPPHRKPNLIYSTFLEYGSGASNDDLEALFNSIAAATPAPNQPARGNTTDPVLL